MSGGSEDIKVILLGDVNVGKTSIYVRYFEDTWNRKYHQNTIGMVYNKVNLTYRDETFTLGVWDTAGSERYTTLTNMYYRNADFAVLCFDPSSLNSWKRVLFWYGELKNHAENCGICICATKKDIIDSREIEPVVDHSEVQKFVQDTNSFYINVSSKTGENIKDLFLKILKICVDDDTRRSYIFAKRYNNQVNNQNIQLANNIALQTSKTCCW